MSLAMTEFERQIHSKSLAFRSPCGCSIAPLLAKVSGLSASLRKFPESEAQEAEVAGVCCGQCGLLSLYAKVIK